MTIYEPRAFWDVMRVEAGETQQSIEMNRNHFYNGTQYPITITKLGIAPLVYGFSTGSFNSPTRNVEAIIGNLALEISARQRYDLTQRGGVHVRNFTTEPGLPVVGGLDQVFVGQDSHFVRQSSRYGAVHARFDKPLTIPEKGAVEFTPSILQYPFSINANFPEARFGLCWHEVGKHLGFGGQGRIKPRTALQHPPQGVPAVSYADWIPSAPINASAGPVSQQTTMMPFPPPHVLSARDFVTQDPARRPGFGSVFSGITVMIDQIDSDDLGASLSDAQSSLSHFANFVGVRAKMTEGGTKQEWWRPGMPLSLACPDMTPAFIHKLSRPFTMEPGEQLEVFVHVPVGAILADVYSAAVAVLGYATIEGVTV